jgi:hypothetical protein
MKQRFFLYRIDIQGARIAVSKRIENTVAVLTRMAKAGFSFVQDALMPTEQAFYGSVLQWLLMQSRPDWV